MPTIKSRIFGPPGAQLPAKKAPDTSVRQMTKLFSQMLAQKPRKRFMFLEAKSFGRIHTDFRTAGKTAALALWVRMNADGVKLDEKGVSVLLGQPNGPGEKKIMDLLRKLAKRLSYPPKLYDEIEKESRPLIATLWFDRQSMSDPALAAATEALAIAFLRPILQEK